MSFLYFVDRRSDPPTPAAAAELGLNYAFEGSIQCREVLGDGPSGTPGQVWADQSVATGALGYFPDRQTWRQIGERVWLGYADLPRPEQLERRQLLAGYERTLGDGRLWVCPIGRDWTIEAGEARWYHRLPCEAVLEGGDWKRGEPIARYREFWQECCRFWDFFTGQLDDDKFLYQDGNRACVVALSQNYRISDEEVFELRLLNDLSRGDILSAVINRAKFDRVREQLEADSEKKTTPPSGCIIDDGQPVETPATGPT